MWTILKKRSYRLNLKIPFRKIGKQLSWWAYWIRLENWYSCIEFFMQRGICQYIVYYLQCRWDAEETIKSEC